MSELSSQSQGLDLRMVDDPGVRQVLRQIHQQLVEKVNRQQLQIDALLDLLVEKNVTSLGELKREIVKLQQSPQRGERLHQALFAPAPAAPHPAPAPGMHAVLR